MPIENDYRPRYVELEDVPVAGPDDYTDSEKRLALHSAESELDLDVNGGDPIPSSDLVEAHETAVVNLATHYLTHAAEEPSDVTLGDMADGGGQVNSYSSQYLDTYLRIIEKLKDAGKASGPDGGHSVSVNLEDNFEGI